MKPNFIAHTFAFAQAYDSQRSLLQRDYCRVSPLHAIHCARPGLVRIIIDYLDVSVCHIDSLRHCSFLRHIRLDCRPRADAQYLSLRPLGECRLLQNLQLSGLNVDDLTPLESLTSLQNLVLVNMPRLTRIEPLARCSCLESIEFQRVGVQDVSSLAVLPRLHTLTIRNCFQLGKHTHMHAWERYADRAVFRFSVGYWGVAIPSAPGSRRHFDVGYVLIGSG